MVGIIIVPSRYNCNHGYFYDATLFCSPGSLNPVSTQSFEVDYYGANNGQWTTT
jgi:hypothetical protein